MMLNCRFVTIRSVMRPGLGLLSLALAIVSGLRADEPKPLSGDLKAFQGEWVSKDDSGESTWVFKAERLSLKTPTRAYEITITLDPESKPEKAIDLKVLDTSPNAKGYQAPGIYKFDGEDKLSICFGGEGADRPKRFEADFQSTFLFELSRKKAVAP